MEKQTFEQNWKIARETQKILGRDDAGMDAEFARLVLHEDLGYLKTDFQTSYSLDDETRDRLIAHARQDAAHAVVQTARLRQMADEIKKTKRLTWIAILMNLAVLAILLAR